MAEQGTFSHPYWSATFTIYFYGRHCVIFKLNLFQNYVLCIYRIGKLYCWLLEIKLVKLQCFLGEGTTVITGTLSAVSNTAFFFSCLELVTVSDKAVFDESMSGGVRGRRQASQRQHSHCWSLLCLGAVKPDSSALWCSLMSEVQKIPAACPRSMNFLLEEPQTPTWPVTGADLWFWVPTASCAEKHFYSLTNATQRYLDPKRQFFSRYFPLHCPPSLSTVTSSC